MGGDGESQRAKSCDFPANQSEGVAISRAALSAQTSSVQPSLPADSRPESANKAAARAGVVLWPTEDGSIEDLPEAAAGGARGAL